ncbi:hypothetical protein GOODEAATRI_017645 [Goodea atripinnis]|uniref:Uncharacterized protein n=1 Tax=Goodea atripinnis TaxID=208336 RepID=A0ABV0NBE1_9TELE
MTKVHCSLEIFIFSRKGFTESEETVWLMPGFCKAHDIQILTVGMLLSEACFICQRLHIEKFRFKTRCSHVFWVCIHSIYLRYNIVMLMMVQIRGCLQEINKF